MKQFLLASAMALALGGIGEARAASSGTVQITIACAVSASFSLTAASPWTVSGVYPTFTMNYPNTGTIPVPANSNVAAIVLSPAGACVINPLSGTGASSFTIVGTELEVGATALPANTSYSITISAP